MKTLLFLSLLLTWVSISEISQENPTRVEITLEDTDWKLEGLNGKPASTGFGSRVPSLRFDSKENRYGGSDGCNDFSGEYEANNGQLWLKSAWTTDRWCIAKEEIVNEFNRALMRITKYKISDGKLELYDADRLLMRLKNAKSSLHGRN